MIRVTVPEWIVILPLVVLCTYQPLNRPTFLPSCMYANFIRAMGKERLQSTYQRDMRLVGVPQYGGAGTTRTATMTTTGGGDYSSGQSVGVRVGKRLPLPPRRRNKKRTPEQMFEEIVAEIEERKAFLEEVCVLSMKCAK